MKLLYFPGCKIDYHLPAYDRSTRAVLTNLDIELVDAELNCCGDPVRHQHFHAFLLSAARILAVADMRGLDILTPCKCCFGSLKHALYWLRRRPLLREAINGRLLTEHLMWQDRCEVIHLLSLLHAPDVAARIGARVNAPLDGIRVAANYGCHALRPAAVTGFDNPTAPRIFEDLITATGASPVAWARRTDCCGSPLMATNPPMAMTLTAQKLDSAHGAGADVICNACTHCQIQYDAFRRQHSVSNPSRRRQTSLLYPQLLGLAMGLSPDQLGIHNTDSNVLSGFTATAGRW